MRTAVAPSPSEPGFQCTPLLFLSLHIHTHAVYLERYIQYTVYMYIVQFVYIPCHLYAHKVC